jgi:hypothetical protein
MFYKNEDGRYVILEPSDHIEQDYDSEEKTIVNDLLENPRYCYLKYSDIDTLRIALVELVKSGKCIIDNDHGDFLPGEEFVNKWQNNPKWNWDLIE